MCIAIEIRGQVNHIRLCGIIFGSHFPILELDTNCGGLNFAIHRPDRGLRHDAGLASVFVDQGLATVWDIAISSCNTMASSSARTQPFEQMTR